MKRKENSFVKIRMQILCRCNPLLSVTERDWKLSGTCIYFLNEEASNGSGQIFTTAGLPGMLEGRYCRSLDKVFSSVAAFVGQSVE